MHICFIDESSTPPKASKRDPIPYFVIAGLSIPIVEWHAISKELEALKARQKFKIRGEIKWRFFGAQNDDPRNNLAHLDGSKRDDFRYELFSILTARSDIKAFAAITNVRRFYEEFPKKSEHELYALTYKPVTERFQYYLQDLSQRAGVSQYGIVVADHRGRDDDARMRQLHHELMNVQTRTSSRYDNLVENLFLTPSDQSVGIQFADMIAGAVSRRYNSNDSTWFDIVEPIFRRSSAGRTEGYGLVQVPKKW